VDSIGNFTFLRISGAPQRAVSRWDVVQRAGVHGTALWDVGVVGVPFTVKAEAAAVSFAAARLFLPNYQSLIVAGPVPVSHGVLETAQFYKVLDVRIAEGSPRAVLRLKIGGDPTWYQAIVESEWDLLPIDPFTPQS
jgi:hypothetical protein